MSKQEKKDLVPKKRFPEFRDEGEWQSKQLGKLSTILRGGSPRPIDSYLTTEQDGLHWLKIGDVDKESKYISRTEARVKVTALSKTREVHPGDLIMSNSMSFGRPYIMQIKSCIHDGWIAVTSITDSVNLDYLYYFILSNSAQTYFTNAAAGGGIKNLNADIIKLLPVSYPELKDEQQKIVDCLTSIDELLTAQTQKLDALKRHKKGLMQQLFPSEGETELKLRFSEFRGKLTKSKIGKVVDLLSGYAFKSEYFSENGTKLLTPKNFTKEGSASFKEGNTKYTSEIVDEKYICEGGDLLLLLTDLTPTCEMLGRPLQLKQSDGKVLLNQRIVKITPKGSVNINFLHYFFSTDSYRQRIKATATGSTVRHSSNKIISGTDVYLPTEPEQQKIADCLSSIDELITAQTQKIEALKAHKKGLMQQLFPVMNEVMA